MIIHLGALIYPLPVVLNVGPFCEPALRIRNEPMAQRSVSPSLGAYFHPHFSVFFTAKGLWVDECPYVIFTDFVNV